MLLVLSMYISLFWGRAECVLCDCCVSDLYILLVMVAALQNSADVVCCSLLLKLDVVVGTLNLCVFYVHYGSTVWVYAMRVTC